MISISIHTYHDGSLQNIFFFSFEINSRSEIFKQIWKRFPSLNCGSEDRENLYSQDLRLLKTKIFAFYVLDY